MGVSADLFELVFIASGKGYLRSRHTGCWQVGSVHNSGQVYSSPVVTAKDRIADDTRWGNRSLGSAIVAIRLRDWGTK